ncbi:MAG: hypothetical protein RLY20_1268 [Verrucomicrobiota bacterium]
MFIFLLLMPHASGSPDLWQFHDVIPITAGAIVLLLGNRSHRSTVGLAPLTKLNAFYFGNSQLNLLASAHGQ